MAKTLNFVRDIASNFLSVQFVKFIAVGILNTIFGYGVFAFFIWLNLHYAFAALLSTICGILFNFKTTGKLVFENSNNALIYRFVGVYACLYVIQVMLLKVFSLFGFDMYLAGFIVIFPLALLSFICNKLFVFERK